MKLTHPAGPRRGYRKARSFHAEIAALRSEGYSCEQIRAALAAAGVVVSKSTMQREISSLSKHPHDHVPQRSSRAPDPVPMPSRLPQTATPSPTQIPITQQRGKDIAEAFFKDRITNPLFLKRQSP